MKKIILSRIVFAIGIINIISLIISLFTGMKGITFINATISGFIDLYFLIPSIVMSVIFIVVVSKIKSRRQDNANIYKKLLRIHIVFVISYAAFWTGIIPFLYLILARVTP